MGGRGSASDFSDAGKKYGTEYKTLLSSGNVKFVQHNNGSAAAPMETMTKGRVYVTVNADGAPKYVSYYDTENKRNKTIDLGHRHNGAIPHTHHGYEHNEKDGPKGAANLTDKERRMVANALKVWYNNKSK